MKGVRFYLEFPTKSTKKRSGKAHKRHDGNVFAAYVEPHTPFGRTNYNGLWVVDGLGAILAHPDSGVAWCSANIRDWLWAKCKRIPEGLARQIHPTLFERLDAN